MSASMAASSRTTLLIGLLGRNSSRIGSAAVSASSAHRLPLFQRSFSSSPARSGQLDSKRIIVTGGAMGIGESVVRAYAAEGASVVSMDVKHELGRRVADQVSATGPGSVAYLPVDVSSKASVTEAFTAAAEKLGGLDVMVNVAGIQKHAAPEDAPEELVEAIMKVNLFGTLYTNAVAFQLFKKYGQGGAILNFGSCEGLTAGHHNTIYGATKGGVHTWTRSVAREWGPFGVRVNAVLPYVITPMYDAFIGAMSPEQLAAHKRELKEQFPLGGNLGDPLKDLGPVMVFLASDASHWMTGQMFPVDGGYIAVR